ncbi:hypothetical protein BSKO_02823 [Bryopsis sp. KO-2023]|nr:hypothetical protein BSKO_02823 [Bryopsis sp. KO-2023]
MESNRDVEDKPTCVVVIRKPGAERVPLGGGAGFEADDEGEEEDRSVVVKSRKRSRDSGSEGDEGAESKRSRWGAWD